VKQDFHQVFLSKTTNLPLDLVRSCLEEKNIKLLLDHDQLIRERESGNILDGFFEGEITFPPTYKYEEYSDQYNFSQRTPGWTDRILFKGLSLIHYQCIEELTDSDHRPVAATLFLSNATDNESDNAIHDLADYLDVECVLQSSSILSEDFLDVDPGREASLITTETPESDTAFPLIDFSDETNVWATDSPDSRQRMQENPDDPSSSLSFWEL